jgi:hypothetical protein
MAALLLIQLSEMIDDESWRARKLINVFCAKDSTMPSDAVPRFTYFAKRRR